MNALKLHLGCGAKRLEGFDNVDYFPSPAVDTVADLSHPRWFWPDNSVEEIFSNHVFEHLDFLHTFGELHRILKPGGIVRFEVPYLCNYCWTINPTHCSVFGYSTFDSWSTSFNSCSDYATPMKWDVLERTIMFMGKEQWWGRAINAAVNPIINFSPMLYERFFSRGLFAASGIRYVLRKP